MALLAAAGAPVGNRHALDGTAVYRPGLSARLCLGPRNALAEFGELHSATLKAFDLGVPVVAAEIYLDFIPLTRSGIGHMRPAYAPPPLPAVNRDFAFLLPTEPRAEHLLRAAPRATKPVLAGVTLSPLLPRPALPAGRTS